MSGSVILTWEISIATYCTHLLMCSAGVEVAPCQAEFFKVTCTACSHDRGALNVIFGLIR